MKQKNKKNKKMNKSLQIKAENCILIMENYCNILRWQVIFLFFLQYFLAAQLLDFF